MLVDCHTHVFPPEVIAARDVYADRDATFGALYASPKAALATASDLLASMEAAAIDVSVALGFAWCDEALCRLHNDYLLEAAAVSSGHIVAFCSLPLGAAPDAIAAEARRCVAAGARGFGELRPHDQGCDLASDRGRLLAGLARELDATLLFHASEPVGHTYAGKTGLPLGELYEFVRDAPDVRVIAAHWGGGLPFYELMPEVREALRRTCFDTAASSLLYSPAIYRQVAALSGADRVLFGSDFPLLSQLRSLRRIAEAGLSPQEQVLVGGENAHRFLGLPP
jgi:predicted TIM-barrel fold metal-dependent hydrolase